MSHRISVYMAYDLVAREMGWRDAMLMGNLDSEAGEVLRKKDFRRILVMSSLTTDPKKVNEFWNYLTDWDLAKRANQYDVVVVNLSRLRDLLAREYPVYRTAVDGRVSYPTTLTPRPRPRPTDAGECPVQSEGTI